MRASWWLPLWLCFFIAPGLPFGEFHGSAHRLLFSPLPRTLVPGRTPREHTAFPAWGQLCLAGWRTGLSGSQRLLHLRHERVRCRLACPGTLLRVFSGPCIPKGSVGGVGSCWEEAAGCPEAAASPRTMLLECPGAVSLLLAWPGRGWGGLRKSPESKPSDQPVCRV